MKESEDPALVAYIDDILICVKKPTEHRLLVSKVMLRCMDNGLVADITTCIFVDKEVKFACCIISAKGVGMAPVKVEAVTRLGIPKTEKELRRFLIFANFYRPFLVGYPRITLPLTNLTRTDVPYERKEQCQLALDDLEEVFTSARILWRFDPNLQMVLQTDALSCAV